MTEHLSKRGDRESGVGNSAGVAGAGVEVTGTQRSKGMGQVTIGLGMLVRRKVTPMWDNNHVWLHGGSRRNSGQGRLQAPPLPQTEIR